MALMNLDSGELRMPLVEMEDKNRDKLAGILKKNGLI
jgi:dihydrodipicolinate synthase/N-acetylneuraminate lyase